MKLEYKLRKMFSFYLKGMENKKNHNKKILKILKNILDENQSKASLNNDINILQHIFNSKDSEYLEAGYVLGLIYFNGLGVYKDAGQAFELFQLAADHGNAEALNSLGNCYYKGMGATKDIKRAAEYYQLAAEKGSANAQNNLALCCLNGTGLNKDEKRAVELFQLATNQGHLEAQFNLGSCYLNGTGITKDEKRGFELYQLAAEEGDGQHIWNLASCYYHGTGVTKDEKRAVELFQLAAKEGIARAQSYLGNCYNGDVNFASSTDKKKAVDFFYLAAEQNYVTAQYNLGAFYFYGLNLNKDEKRGILLFQAASIQNSVSAIAVLNKVYSENKHTPKLEEAVSFYQKHYMENNDISALTTLAFCYQMGLGTGKNLNEAIKYYLISLDKGSNCYWDLYACYRSEVNAGCDIQMLLDFYATLKYKAQDNPNAAELLGYLYENGTLGLEKNIHTALFYYNMANKVNFNYSKDKINYYTPMLENIRNECQIVLPTNLCSIISEYAFEYSKP